MTISLLLVAEAETSWTADGRAQGDVSVPPLPEKLAELQQLSEKLKSFKVGKIYASRQEPGISTARKIARHLAVSVCNSPVLRPLNLGVWAGLNWTEIEERWGRMYRRWRANPEKFSPPLGESMLNLTQPLMEFIDRIRQNEDNVLLIGSPEVLVACCAFVLPRYGATSNSHNENGQEYKIWNSFDFSRHWMVWNLLLDDEG